MYLTDIGVRTIDHETLKTDPYTALLCHRGTLCLHHYINLYDIHIPLPDMDARLYLAPPWTGSVLTPPHIDGHGTQLSLHRVLMGGGYNLVHVWPSFLPAEDHKWREVVHLPPAHRAQPLPHDIKYSIDCSPNEWDVEKEALLTNWGIYSSKFEVRPGEAIVLPPTKAHVFKKIGNTTDNSPGVIPVPILGYAGDCSYVGPSAESFGKNFLNIQVHLNLSLPPFRHVTFATYSQQYFNLSYLLCSMGTTLSEGTRESHTHFSNWGFCVLCELGAITQIAWRLTPY